MRGSRVLAASVAVTIALFVLGATHYYLARRLVLDPELGEPISTLLLALLCALLLAMIALPFAERALPRRIAKLLVWPTSLWMGFYFLLFMLLAASDLVLWIAGSPALAAVSEEALGPGPARWRAGVVAALVALAGGAGLISALRGPKLQRLEVQLRRWPDALDGFRIVQLSDLHIGPILDQRFARELASRCNALAPDLIAVTGDLVDGSVAHLRAEVEPLRELRAPYGVYFVTGNHDHYSGARAWVPVIQQLGMRVLHNERVAIEREGAVFDLCGVDDYHGSFEPGTREDLDLALEGRDSERPLVLLAHDPRTFRRARRRGVDLQLSGHTHGGQIWPFRFFVRLVTRWVAGLYQDGDAKLYVSRGTGFWGPPMRLFAPAEITELVLRRCAAPERLRANGT